MNVSRRDFLAHASAATVLSAAAGAPFAQEARAFHRPPNVIFILTDNQNPSTLGCYGNPDIRTPNIDRLAAEGVRFTRAISSNPVCSPTRATYLTGLLPSQHGIHSFLNPRALVGPEAYNPLREFQTLPTILQSAGYTCGLSGKWHLGDCSHPAPGFTSWVTMPTGDTKTFYDKEIIENGIVRKQPGYITDFWTRRGVRFIEENKDHPFFLYLAYNGPFSVGRVMLKPARNRFASFYAKKDLPSFPHDSMHPWQFEFKELHNSEDAKRRLAAECSGVDDGVGEIMSTLKRLGLDENTLVIYAADQGCMIGETGIWGMGTHTRPFSAFEGMAHVPLIFRHPGKINAGITNESIVSNYDFLSTLLNYLGLEKHIPSSPKSPGRDYSPFLTGKSLAWENVMFYEIESVRAVREERWKYVARYPDGPKELYDMQIDPHERVNLFGQPQVASIQKRVAKRLDAFFDHYADPRYDLWHGGVSKPATSFPPNQTQPIGENDIFRTQFARHV